MMLTVKGMTIQVLNPELKGTENDPGLLFVHGAGGNGELWERQAEFLEGKHSAFRLNLPGHGGSAPQGEDRISSYAQWVQLCAERLFETRPFVLVGHSMGGAIALELAVIPRTNLKGIVLVGSGAKLAVTRAIFQMLSENPEAFFETIGRFASSPAAPLSMKDRFVFFTRQCAPSTIFNDFKACDNFDIRSRLPEIRLPALVLCGDEDQLTPVKYSRYLCENLQKAHLLIIPKAGHMVMVEQPAAVNEAIESFLSILEI
jgi:pimeloyl-ACP methyl ester carboxylesterase